LVRSTLAIYITLFAVAVVAVAQILYWKLVIARDRVHTEDTGDASLLSEALVTWPEIALDAAEMRLAAETLLASETRSAAEPVLVTA
jgi:hypothetical protein